MMQSTHTRPPKGILPGEWDPPLIELDAPNPAPQIIDLGPGALGALDVLTPADCKKLIDAMKACGKAEPVSIQGRQDIPDDRTGSVRATAWAPALGHQFWHKLRAIVPQTRTMCATTPTDWFAPTAHLQWEAIDVSPVLRFMKYEAGGQHYAHYDAGFDYGDGRRTLMSLVFYLTSVGEHDGGHTRIIEDHQSTQPTWTRDHEDWPRETHCDEVLHTMRPTQGAVMIFDHRLCHDVEQYHGPGERIIIRGDIVFRATDDAVALESLL